MLEFLMKERRDVFALLYEEDDGRAKKILQRLESIDNELDKDDIILVKCSDEGMLKILFFSILKVILTPILTVKLSNICKSRC